MIDRDRRGAARSFHCAVVYFESLRIFGNLTPNLEARQRYAQWRTRQFSHLLEVATPGVNRKRVILRAAPPYHRTFAPPYFHSTTPLYQNCVHENVADKRTVHDVYDIQGGKEGLLGSGSYGTVHVAVHKQVGCMTGTGREISDA